MLRRWPAAGGQAIRIFERDGQGEIRFGKSFVLSGYRQVLSKVRANASLIATLAQFDHGPSLLLPRMAASIITNIFIEKVDLAESKVLRSYADNPQMVEALNRDIERIDLGIKAMSIESSSGGPVARFEHEGLPSPMPIQLESHGTRQFIRIFPLIVQALNVGGVAIIDKLDLAIHPTVLPEILRWFYEPKRNPLNPQLWMSCHNASLRDDLVKEEIYFCERTFTVGAGSADSRTFNRYGGTITITKSIWGACTELYRNSDEAAQSAPFRDVDALFPAVKVRVNRDMEPCCQVLSKTSGLHLAIHSVLPRPGGGDPLDLITLAVELNERDERRRGRYSVKAVLLDLDRLGVARYRDRRMQQHATNHHLHLI
jgi:hypothetical protein